MSSPLSTDFNVSPYFDDYDEDKRFSRILFRPAVAVQARELTQSQTILQNQIQRFGDHIFKDGSVVDGVGFVYYPNVHFISLDDTLNTNPNTFISELANNSYLVTNMNETQSSNAVRGVIKLAIDGNKAAAPLTNRLYIDYISTGTNTSTNTDINEFQPGDTLYFYSASQSKFGTLDSTNQIDSISTLSSNGSFTSNGYAYCIGVSDGVVYQKGFFTKVPAQTIAVGNTLSTNVTGYVVGFDTVESIVTENQDPTLNDNALGYDNENAPGAHRLKLTPTLVSKLKTDVANNTNFFSIIEFDGQEPTQQKSGAQYAVIQSAIAERTYEESGDYVVRPFQLDTLPSSNSSTFYYELSSGVAYVRGYQIEKLNSTRIETDRATTTDFSTDKIITVNYGNYVICNEYLGSFDHESLASVDIRSAPQLSLTQLEGTSNNSDIVGTAIGTANIRAIQYDQGDIGTASAQYYVYLFNIQMGSGYSFSNAQSITVNTGISVYGGARADIVLENDIAVLKNPSSNFLVWDTKIPAVKRLTDNTGITDTSFIYTQIANGTFANNGNVTITISPAALGATSEQLIHSPATYTTDAILDQYNIFFSANAHTANLTGNVAINSGNATIIGSGTLFQTQLAVDGLLRYLDGANPYFAKIVSIASNTSLTVANLPSVTNAAAKFQRFYVSGSPVPLQSITVHSNSQFTGVYGYNFDSANQTSYASFPVQRNGAKAISKIINKNILIKVDCSNNAANSVGPWDLGLVDVLKIRSVYVGNTVTGYSNTLTNRSDWFTLDDGQRDDIYDHGKLYVKPEYASNIASTTRLLIELDNFTANVGGGSTAGVGFFSVESYPIDDANTANTNAIQTIEIPTYDTIDLRSSIDVRARKYNTATVTAALASATVNPAVSNTSFDVFSGGQHTMTPDENFSASYEYYLPRYDLITINSNGDTTVKKGIPSVSPRTPFVESDQSAVAEIYVPAYPSITKREADTYKRYDDAMRINILGNRRYTMKDIGTLDDRIKTLEYYTVLNTLEQSARDLTIPDAAGLNRFKNGIFADPFNSHNIGNVTDFEYKIAIDERETVARPHFKTYPIDYTFSNASSSNVAQNGAYVTLNYNNEKFISQEYATKYRVCCESIWQWNGILSLYPSQDIFNDETVVANELSLNLRRRPPEGAFNSFAGVFGRWATRRIRRGLRNQSSATRANTSQSQRETRNNIRPNTVTERVEVGSHVTDVSYQPYARSRKVAFIAYNMKPNTTLHAFFDNTNVDQFCAPGTVSNTAISTIQQGREDAVVTQSGDLGAALVSNSSGGIAGVFNIPAQTFRSGDRLFQLNTVTDLTTGASAQISQSVATYTASDLAVTRQTETLLVTQPVARPRARPRNRQRDPIAQSFTVTGLPDDVTGISLTRVGVYFQAKDATLGCTVYICETDSNGAPKSDKILASAYKKSSDITVNATLPTSETVFNLDHPVFLLSDKDYAFIVEPDGNSPEYTVWVGETGGYDVNSGAQVFSNPYSGILWISSNLKTWTGIQKEDMMFNLYRAKYTTSSGTAIFKNESDDFFTISGVLKTTNFTSNFIDIGDVVYTVNTHANGLFNTANTSAGYPFGVVQYIDEASNKLYLDSSTGNFSNAVSGFNPTIGIFRVSDPSNTALIVANAVVATANIATIDNFTYHAISPNFAVLEPSKTSIDYSYKGVNASASDTTYITIDNGVEYEFLDQARLIKSVSNESGTKSSEIKINLTSESDYVSPLVSLQRKSALVIENIINNDSTNEHTRYGNAATKYVSTQIILADGQDAEDIRVYLTAYRPVDTDIEIYGKFLNAQDPEPFDDKIWSQLSYANNTDLTYSSPTDVENYIEYEFVMPTVNAVAQGAFSNTTVSTTLPLTGNVAVTNNSTTITGTGTNFTTDFSAGQTIKIASNSTFYAFRTITSIANTTSMTVDLGLPQTNTATLYYLFSSAGNDGILEYKNSAGSRFIGYKYFAIKIVLLSSNAARTPRLQDVRAIAMQI